MATIPPGIRFVHDKTVWEMPAALADSVAGPILDPERAIRRFYSALSARVGAPIDTVAEMDAHRSARAHAKADASAAERSVRRLIAAYPEDLEGYGMRSDLALRGGDTTTARQALTDALQMLGRLEIHDVYESERKRKLIETALARAPALIKEARGRSGTLFRWLLRRDDDYAVGTINAVESGLGALQDSD